MLRASRALVGIAAASLAGIDEVVAVPQLRVLVMVCTRGPLNLAAVAADLAVNPSNASRTCDRLLHAGLLDRRESPIDRRHITLTLTPGGRRLVEKVTKRRRTAIERVLRTMTAAGGLPLPPPWRGSHPLPVNPTTRRVFSRSFGQRRDLHKSDVIEPSYRRPGVGTGLPSLAVPTPGAYFRDTHIRCGCASIICTQLSFQTHPEAGVIPATQVGRNHQSATRRRQEAAGQDDRTRRH